MDTNDTTEYALAFDLDATQGPGLRFTYDDCERARSLAIIFEKITPKEAYDILTTLGEPSTSSNGGGKRITRPAFDAAIRRLAPHAKSLSEAKRLYLSESLDCVWNQFVQMMENNEDDYATLPGKSHFWAPNGSTTVTELAIGFSMLCKGSKSDKLQFAWNLLDTDNDGALTRQQFWQLLSSILIMLLSISTMGRNLIIQRQEYLALSPAEQQQTKQQQRMVELHNEAKTIRDWIDDMAVEATQMFFAESTVHKQSTGNNGQDRPVNKALLTFMNFGDIYNNGGHLLLPFLELLDSRKWPVTPLVPSSSLPTPTAALPPSTLTHAVVPPPVPTTVTTTTAHAVVPPPVPTTATTTTAAPSPPVVKATVAATKTNVVVPPTLPASTTNRYTVQEPETDEDETNPEDSIANGNRDNVNENNYESNDEEISELSTDDETYLREWNQVHTATVPETTTVPVNPPSVPSETSSLSSSSVTDPALYFQLLTEEDGTAAGLGPVELRIGSNDILHYITFLQASGLDRIQSEHVLYAALEACDHGMPYLTMEAFMRTIALLLTSDSQDENNKRSGNIPDMDMRMIVTALTNIFSTLSFPDGESDVLDVLMTLLPFAAGSKTEKLRWAWRLLDENLENSSVIDTNDNDTNTPTLRVHSLGRREIWRALRGILIAILVMCRGKFMNAYEIPNETVSYPPNYIPEPISDDEAKEIQTIADAVAITGTTSIFHETADFRQDYNTITLEELSIWYNNGGYKAVPWLELLNTQKWIQHYPSYAVDRTGTVVPARSTVVDQRPPVTTAEDDQSANDNAVDNDEDYGDDNNDGEISPGPETDVPDDDDDVSSSYTEGDTVITRVSGAKIVIQVGLDSDNQVPEDPDKDTTSSSSRWYFSTLACDLVRHISEISGLYNVSVTQISRTIQHVVKATNGTNKTSSAGHGKHMINLETYNACIRVLIPVARLTRPDRQHLSRLFGALFDALDTTRAGIVDWRDISVALSVYAGKGSKSDKIVHAFDLYRRRSYTEQGKAGPSQVNKDGLFRYLRAFFTSLAVIQENGAELDLSLQCMMYRGQETSTGQRQQGSPASTASSAMTSPLGLPTSVRIGLRTRSQRTAQVSMAANAFTRSIFNEINTSNNTILKNAGYTGAHEWRMIGFPDLANLYNEGGGHSTMPFFELLAISRWLNFVIPVPDNEMRMILSYAAASPLALAAEAHEAVHEVEELRATASRAGPKTGTDASSGGNDEYYNEDSEEDDELAAVAADVAQEKAEYERLRKQNPQAQASVLNGIGNGSTGSNHVREESAIDEGGVDGDEDSETGSAQRIGNQQSARAAEVIARMFATPVFSFALPRIDDEGNTSTLHADGHGVSENGNRLPYSPFLLTLLPKDCAALQRVLFTGRLDSIDSDALLTLLRSASRDGTYITRSAYTSCVGRLLPNSSAGVPLQDLMWTEAALQGIFTAYDRFGNDNVPLSDIACGLLLLCTGNKSQKLAAAWPLFDENQDGNLDLPELTALLHAFLVMLFVIKAWGKYDSYEAMMMNVNDQIVSDADYDAITAAVIALGDAAYRGSISLETVTERQKNVSIPFIAFGNFYNRLAANTVVSSKDSTGGSEDYLTENETLNEFLNVSGIEPESFMWLELLDVRKYPTTAQMAMQAANMVTDLEAQENEQQPNRRSSHNDTSEQGSTEDDSAYAYVRLPDADPNETGNDDNEEGSSGSASTDSKNPLTSLPGMRPVYTLQLTTTGDTLLVSELDLYAMQRVSYVSPLARMSPDDLISLLSAYVNPKGMITRQAFDDIVTAIIEEASEMVLQTFGMALVNSNDGNGQQNRLAARAALRDCSMLGDMLMRIFELLDTDGNGAVDAIEFIPALMLLTDGYKSTKLSSAWRLRAGSDEGRLDRVDVASFLACFLLAVYGVTCAGDELPTDTIREIVVRAASESSRFIFLLANLHRQQNPQYVPNDTENDTISFADFASFYNGSTSATRDLGFSGFLIVPYLELLDSRKWAVPGLQPSSATGDDNETGNNRTGTTATSTAASSVVDTNNYATYSANYADAMDDGNGKKDDTEAVDDEEEEEENDDSYVTNVSVHATATRAEPSSDAASVPSSSSVQPVNGNEIVYGFLLTSDRSRLNLTRDDVGNFLDFVISSGFHRLSSDRIIRTILNQAEMSTANENTRPEAIPLMYKSDYNDAIGELLDTAFTERHRANSIDLTAASNGNEQAALIIQADLDIAQFRLEEVFNAFVDRQSGTVDSLEIALGLGMLVGGTGRKSDKLVAGWQAAALATGGVLRLQKNGDSSFSSLSGTGQLTLTRPVFVSFLRAILITLMVFGHVELNGQGSVNSNGPRRHGVYYLLATEAADDIAQHVFSTVYAGDDGTLDDAEITLDAFASFYNDHGWESAGFLELLDLSKWGPSLPSLLGNTVNNKGTNGTGTGSNNGSSSSSKGGPSPKGSPTKSSTNGPLTSVSSPGKVSLPSPSQESSLPYGTGGTGGSSTRPDSSLAPTNRTDTSRSSSTPPSSPSRDTSVLPQSSSGSYTEETTGNNPTQTMNPATLASLGGQRFQFELLSRYPLYIMGADVDSLAFIRNKSNLPSLSAPVFLDTLIKACVPGYDSKLHGPFDGSTRIDYDTFRTAIRSLVPGTTLNNDEKHQLSKEFLRLYFCLEEYTRFIDSSSSQGSTGSTNGGVPFADIYTALLYLTNGAKTEKLLNAFYIYDTNQDDALTISQCTSLIRSLLIGILAFRSNAHMDVETDTERQTVDALVDIANQLGEIIFTQAVTEVGELTFTEFGTFYNGGGFVALPFIELLDWKKFSGETVRS